METGHEEFLPEGSQSMKKDFEEAISSLDSSELEQDIASLYLSREFSDITFIISEQKIYAHKAILGVRSKHFKKLFGSTKEAHSEITLTDVEIDVFKKLLQFIYTGFITIASTNLDNTLKVLDLAVKYCLDSLKTYIAKNLVSIITIDNVCQILEKTNSPDFLELTNSCLDLVDKNASEFLKIKNFRNEPEKILIKILQRSTFSVPEIDIFKAVAEWYKTNGKTSDYLLKCVRLSLLTIEEIYSIVEPTKLVDNDILVQVMGEINGFKPKTSDCRLKCFDAKSETLTENAGAGTDSKRLQNTNIINQEIRKETSVKSEPPPLNIVKQIITIGNHTINVDKIVNWPENRADTFSLKLDSLISVNNINFTFHQRLSPHIELRDLNNKKNDPYVWYCYYCELSIDGNIWKKVIDYSRYKCRNNQEVYFEKQFVQYIRLVVTEKTAGMFLDLLSLDTYSKNSIPKLVNGFVCPSTNIALISRGASLLRGDNKAMLEGNFGRVNYTSCDIFSVITIQFAQPYMIDTIKLWLYDLKGTSFQFIIESSVNHHDWDIIVNKTEAHCRSWKVLTVETRPIVFIRIVKIINSINNGSLCCHYIECFSKK